MRHLKKFENFDLGRFNTEDEIENEFDEIEDMDDIDEIEEDEFEDEDEDEEEDEMRRRVWGDERVVEKKKMNAGFKDFLDKQKEKKADKEEKSDKKDDKKSKKDDKKDSKKDDKSEEGLTAAQKKLPEGLKKAILKKKKK